MAADDLKVTRLRVSYIATRIHERVTRDLGGPDAFARLLLDPQEVEDLQVTLPFKVDPADRSLEVDSKFWTNATGRVYECPRALTRRTTCGNRQYRCVTGVV
jgi:hypothetical protein